MNPTSHIIELWERSQDHLAAGQEWYPKARAFCDQLSFWHDRPLWKVCAIVSALSPQISWERDQSAAEQVLVGDWDALYDVLPVSVAKARLIDRGARPYATAFPLKTSPKTNNFYHNILKPEAYPYITIDTRMVRIADGFTNKWQKFNYIDVANLYLDAAKQIGVLPNVLQATLWCAEREGAI